jgi:hypothetical protein
MKRNLYKNLAILIFASAIVFLSSNIVNAQWNTPNAWGYNTGYGAVYGSFGLAATMQNMYNVAKAQAQKTNERNAVSGSTSSSRTKTSVPKIAVPPAPVVRNHGVFRPEATIDTGKAIADALGDTPEQKALIKQIYTVTKAEYEKEAAAKGWKNNIAGGLTFFTVTAMTIYHDSEEPGANAVDTYFKVVNSALDEMPEFANVSNKDKQGFNNMLIGFSGILLAGYTEGKQTGDANTLADYKKLAGMLIEMVLKTDPEKIRLENGRIVLN